MARRAANPSIQSSRREVSKLVGVKQPRIGTPGSAGARAALLSPEGLAAQGRPGGLRKRREPWQFVP